MNYLESLKRIEASTFNKRAPITTDKSKIFTDNEISLLTMLLLVGYRHLEKDIQDLYIKEKYSLEKKLIEEEDDRFNEDQKQWKQIYENKIKTEFKI